VPLEKKLTTVEMAKFFIFSQPAWNVSHHRDRSIDIERGG
jgi:hypothetical protein